MLFSVMSDLAGRATYGDYKYIVRRTSGTPDFARGVSLDVISCTIHAIFLGDERQIGRVSLRLRSKEQTLFGVSKADKDTGNWLPVSSIIFASDDELLKHFLKLLWEEFEHEGFTGSNLEERTLNTEFPKAFIAHGGKSDALTKLVKFLRALGVEPLVVEEQASKAKSVDDKVEYYMNLADFAIIIATRDDQIDGKWYPRQNVAHETGLAQKTCGDKIIYLKEEGAEFPSNISPKVWEPFTQQSMDRAFIAVVRELNAFEILKAAKPAKKQANA